jgi:hypothetical protein
MQTSSLSSIDRSETSWSVIILLIYQRPDSAVWNYRRGIRVFVLFVLPVSKSHGKLEQILFLVKEM